MLTILAPQCGGTLLNSRTLLTAAHCLRSVKNIQDLRVYSDRPNLNKTCESEGCFEFIVTNAIKHPDFDLDIAISKMVKRSDIAIFKLKLVKSTYEFPDFKIIIDDGSVSPEGSVLTAVGWGRYLPFSQMYSFQLREAQLKVISSNECNSTIMNQPVKPQHRLMPETELCAISESRNSSMCAGDSGGGIFYTDGNTVTIVGVTSWSASPAECSPNVPSVFVRVSATDNRNFIISHM